MVLVFAPPSTLRAARTIAKAATTLSRGRLQQEET